MCDANNCKRKTTYWVMTRRLVVIELVKNHEKRSNLSLFVCTLHINWACSELIKSAELAKTYTDSYDGVIVRTIEMFNNGRS